MRFIVENVWFYVLIELVCVRERERERLLCILLVEFVTNVL